MPFIKVSSPNANIWEENPALSLISEFKQFKAAEGDKRSSNILKAIFYIWDPKSELKNSGISGEKLIEDITKNIIKDKDFNWIAYSEIRELYLEYNISKLESMYLGYEKEITDLKAMLDEWPVKKTDVEKRSKVVKLYKELFEDCISVKAQMEEEWEAQEELYAGYTKSKLESYGTDQ